MNRNGTRRVRTSGGGSSTSQKWLASAASDWYLLGLDGTREDAEEIKARIRQFLHDELKLELSETKTLITHASTDAARFLNYQITNQQTDTRIIKTKTKGIARRYVNGRIALLVPKDVLDAKCARYMENGKVIHRSAIRVESDFSIVLRYQLEYRGIVQYYILAHNVRTLNKLHWVARTSLLKTLAGKHRTTTSSIREQYTSTIKGADGKVRNCLAVEVEREGKPPLIARFGGIPLIRQPDASLIDTPYQERSTRTEILTRLLANTCEVCGSTSRIEVHHIRKLADLKGKHGKERPAWVKYMAAIRRKTLVVCHDCHRTIHEGKL